jgi:glycosyltransferase involved in cell wall biosynthesis
MAPFLSVIIPTLGRPAQLERCLASLAAQDYAPERWELIVVIDGEDRASLQVLRDWQDRLPLRYFEQAHAGCGMARNAGAAQARGEDLIFTDDDCLFPQDWLDRYAAAFLRADQGMVAGRSENYLKQNPFSQATQDLIDYLVTRCNADPEAASLAIGNNFGVPAKGFAELGGFSQRYFRAAAEDRDFCGRWLAQGGRILYAPEVLVLHAHALTLRSFVRQHMHYGRGAWLLHTSGADKRQPAGFYLSMFLEPGSPRALALLALSQAAQTAGYASGWLRGLLGRG